MSAVIRPATAADAAGMVQILNPIIEAGCYTAMTSSITPDEQLTFIRGFPAAGIFHVAEDTTTGQLMGMQDVMPQDEVQSRRAGRNPRLSKIGEISTFVALAGHRRGIGRQLFAATVSAARERGYQQILATIRSDNADAQAYYRSQGFREPNTTPQDQRPTRAVGSVVLEYLIQ